MTGGGIKCWGKNNFGQLGIENTTNQNSPVYIGFGSGVHECSLELKYCYRATEKGRSPRSHFEAQSCKVPNICVSHLTISLAVYRSGKMHPKIGSSHFLAHTAVGYKASSVC